MLVSSPHPDRPWIRNSLGPKSSVRQNSACFPLPWHPKSRSCLSHTQPLAIPSISAGWRSPCEHDLPLVSPQSLHCPSAPPIFERFVQDPSEVAHREPSCTISEAKPDDTCILISYGV